MNYFQAGLLAVVQGLAELLPVSSSAHVIFTEKLLGLDPTSPEMTLLLVMLHTGTMFAVIAYFWSSWKAAYFSSWNAFRTNAQHLLLATAATGMVGLALLYLIKHVFFAGASSFEIEHLFGNNRLIAAALSAAGLLILSTSRLQDRPSAQGENAVQTRSALWIGAVQGLCLPFRGFSRSGATISTALAQGVGKRQAEAFSFALAVVLTPAVIVREAWRLHASHSFGAAAAHTESLWSLVAPSLFGMVVSFGAGLLALRWLSGWLENGRWHYFGLYCLVFAGITLAFG